MAKLTISLNQLFSAARESALVVLSGDDGTCIDDICYGKPRIFTYKTVRTSLNTSILCALTPIKNANNIQIEVFMIISITSIGIDVHFLLAEAFLALHTTVK